MAHTIQEFAQLDLSAEQSSPCSLCKQPILADERAEMQNTSEGPAHGDCYYDALSGAIEQHPLGTPGTHR
jgi:hypothetical protein